MRRPTDDDEVGRVGDMQVLAVGDRVIVRNLGAGRHATYWTGDADRLAEFVTECLRDAHHSHASMGEIIGHTLSGPDGDFVVVEHDPRAGLWVRNITSPGDSRGLRCISERAVGRTFAHRERRCARCMTDDARVAAARGFDSRAVYIRDYGGVRLEPEVDHG